MPGMQDLADHNALVAQNTSAADDLDAWVCADCGGEGRVTVYHNVSHQLGTDSLPFWETCTACDGLKFCGPDAEKRAAIAGSAA